MNEITPLPLMASNSSFKEESASPFFITRMIRALIILLLSRWRELAFLTVLIDFLIILPTAVEGKGGASRGVSVGGSAVCSDCAGVDTEEETQASIIVVSVICIIFLVVCLCQCYQKFAWELKVGGKKPMPMAPYDRDNSNKV